MTAPENAFTYEELANQVEVLQNISVLVAGEENPRELLGMIMDLAKDFMKAEASSLLMLDAKRNEFSFAFAHGKSAEDLKGARLPADKGICGFVVQSEEAVLVENAYTDPRFSDQVDKITGHQTKYMLSVPLKAKGVIVGVLQVINPVKGYFHEGEIKLFKHFADLAAIAIHRSEMEAVLERQLRQMAALHEVSKAMTSEFNLQPLLERIMDLAKGVMRAEASSLMLLDHDTDELVFQVAQGEKGTTLQQRRIPKTVGIAGFVASHGEPLLIEDAYADSRFNPEMDRKTGFRTRSILTVPLKTKGKILGIVQVINPVEGGAFTESDLELFIYFAGSAAVAVDNAQLYEKSLMSERLAADLETASAIQHEILPRQVAPLSGFEVATFYQQPHHGEPAGDYYDLLSLEDGRLCALVADVSGHGTGASLVMAMTKALLHSALSMNKTFRDAIIHVNETLVKILGQTDHTLFVTALLLMVDSKNQTMQMVRCGHTPLMVVKNGKGEALEPGGMLLGILAGEEFESTLEVVELRYNQNDVLVLFTDGITEAMDHKGNMYGEEQMILDLEKLQGFSAHRIKDDLLGEVYLHMGNEKPRDDITLMVLKCIEEPELV